MNQLCLNLFQFSPYVSGGRPVPPIDALLGAAADAGFPLVGLDMYSLETLGLAPGELAGALTRHGVACYEMLGLQIDDDEATALAMTDAVARWVAESGARQVLTVSNGTPDRHWSTGSVGALIASRRTAPGLRSSFCRSTR